MAPVLDIVTSPEIVVQVGAGVALFNNIWAAEPAANLDTAIAAVEII